MRGRLAMLAVAGGLAAAVTGGASQLDLGDAVREVTLPLRHDDIIRQQADQKGLDPSLIAAVIYAESRFVDQTSAAGARGLMQVTPETARVVARLSGGVDFVTDDLSDPDINIRYGSFYLRYLLERFDGNEIAALAGYNAGPENVEQWGGSSVGHEDIAFPETVDYVEEVLEKRQDYRDGYREDLGIE